MLIKKYPTRLNIPSAAAILIALFLILPSTQAADQSLDDQKARLLDRIIETEDDALRDRLVKIYESLEETTEQPIASSYQSPISSPSVTGCTSGDCRDGQGTMTYADGGKYVGAWKGGKRTGQGTLIWGEGDKYVGEWKDEKRTGQGTYTWANGETYVGQSKDGDFNGQGTMTYADGRKYVGQFKDGDFNGQGTMTYADGGKYVGAWKDGKRTSQGTMTYSDGGTYIGECKEWHQVEKEVMVGENWLWRRSSPRDRCTRLFGCRKKSSTADKMQIEFKNTLPNPVTKYKVSYVDLALNIKKGDELHKTHKTVHPGEKYKANFSLKPEYSEIKETNLTLFQEVSECKKSSSNDKTASEKIKYKAKDYYCPSGKENLSEAQIEEEIRRAGNIFAFATNDKIHYGQQLPRQTILKLATDGYSPAQIELGKMYRFGEGGVRQDTQSAMKWFQMAAECGDPVGQYWLAFSYMQSTGVAPNQVLAKFWFEKSANNGHPDAQLVMGGIYQSGYGGAKPDQNEAMRWLVKAAAQGNEIAAANAEKLRVKMKQTASLVQDVPDNSRIFGRLVGGLKVLHDSLENERQSRNRQLNKSIQRNKDASRQGTSCQLDLGGRQKTGTHKTLCTYSCPGTFEKFHRSESGSFCPQSITVNL